MLVLLKDLGLEYPTIASIKKRRYGLYKCFCGKEFKTQMQDVKSEKTKSCGCIKKSMIVSRNKKNITHSLSSHRLYSTWKKMINRCNNPKNKDYKYYGGRGITVCNRWLNIENFIEDMYQSHQEGLSLDRINVNGNYEKDNCRWATKEIQARNTRRIMITNKSGYRGVSFIKSRNKWGAKITIRTKKILLGTFKTALEAAKAYDKYIIENNLEHTLNGVYNG